jgi:nitrogen fixation protein FixH
MTAVSAGDLGPTTIASMSGGRKWIGLIFGLILMNMGIVAMTIYFASSDRSAGVEPDYYARALNYDRVIDQRAENQRLGWSAGISLTAADGGGKSAVLRVKLVDREGVILRDALVRAEAFSSLRSAERNALLLRETGDEYIATVPVSAAGLWRVRLAATCGTAKFTSEQDVVLQSPTSRDAAAGKEARP